MTHVRILNAASQPLPDATVEFWTEFPARVLPADVPVDALRNVPAGLARRLRSGFSGQATTDQLGAVSVPSSVGPAFTLRVFDSVDGHEWYQGYATVSPMGDTRSNGEPSEESSDPAASTKSTDSTWDVWLQGGSGPVPKVAGATLIVLAMVAAGWWTQKKKSSTNGDTQTPPTGTDAAPRWAAPPGLAGDVSFIYQGEDARQTGLNEDALDVRQIAVLRGRVTDTAGEPLSDVTVTLLNHPEFGQTTTDQTGVFDMVVNGGGHETVVYTAPNRLSAYRELYVPWQDYRWLPDVVLVADEGPRTTVEFGTTGSAVVESPRVTDDDGSRRGVLYVPPGTLAKRTVDGKVTATMELDVRVTEVTVGQNGPAAMPANLPAGTGYTYAVDFGGFDINGGGSGPERPVLAGGAGDVQFDRPLIYYVENFLGFPVGGIAPSGAYDSSQTAWSPSQNGRVVELVGVTGGRADLDVDGSGVAADAATLTELGITDDEQRVVAQHFDPGTSLWRVPIPHFSLWDINWPIMPPQDAIAPILKRVFEPVSTIVDCVVSGGS